MLLNLLHFDVHFYSLRRLLTILGIASASALTLLSSSTAANAQSSVTGTFTGWVTDQQTRKAIPGANVKIINKHTNVSFNTTTNSEGRFIKYELAPGYYRISVSVAGYQAVESEQTLYATEVREIIPPFELKRKRTKGKRKR